MAVLWELRRAERTLLCEIERRSATDFEVRFRERESTHAPQWFTSPEEARAEANEDSTTLGGGWQGSARRSLFCRRRSRVTFPCRFPEVSLESIVVTDDARQPRFLTVLATRSFVNARGVRQRGACRSLTPLWSGRTVPSCSPEGSGPMTRRARRHIRFAGIASIAIVFVASSSFVVGTSTAAVPDATALSACKAISKLANQIPTSGKRSKKRSPVKELTVKKAGSIKGGVINGGVTTRTIKFS